MATTLTIQTSGGVPDSTYFRVGSCEPDLDADGATLTIYDGDGSRRSSWGAPGVTSTVVLHADDLVAVHVGFHHKHGGGQFWRYVRPVSDGARWERVGWAALDDEDRQRVLDAVADGKAPSWAKAPGKLRSERRVAARETQTAYKIVRISDDGRYVSAYDGVTEYALGKRLAERARPDHGGGYYSYPSADGVEERFWHGALLPERCYVPGARYAVLEVEIGGRVVVYGGDEYFDDMGVLRETPIKLASTYLTPRRVLDETLVWAAHLAQEAC